MAVTMCGVQQLADEGASWHKWAAKSQLKLRRHTRFMAALALRQIVNQTRLPVVAEQFGFTRGSLQALQSQVAGYAGMLVAFCRELSWTAEATLLAAFGARCDYAVRTDLVPLLQAPLPGLDIQKALVLVEGGFTTPHDLTKPGVTARHVAAALSVRFINL